MSDDRKPKYILGVLDLNSKAVRIGAAVWSVCLLWLFVGILLPLGLFHLPRLEQAAYFGDMFGAVNALFSSLAFVGIAITLYLQQKQIDISQKAARIESFTFLAELQYRLMNDAPDGRQASFKNSARYCLARSIDLMRSLNEDFPGSSPDVIGTAFYSQSDYALADLVDILHMFMRRVYDQDQRQTTTMTVRHEKIGRASCRGRV